MRKLFYLLMLLLLSFTCIVSCSSDNNGEPEVPVEPPPPPPPPTKADSLQGVWCSYYASIKGTAPLSPTYEFTTNLIILGYDTLKFSGSNVTHKWMPLTISPNWARKTLTGTFNITGAGLTNSITYESVWIESIEAYENNTVSYNHTYTTTFSAFPGIAPYTKDTLTLIMNGATEITANSYNNAMGMSGNTGTNAINEPIITLKFKRIP